MKYINIFLILLSILFIYSCTDNERARNWGGTEEVKLKKNHTLITVTWKETSLWILTKDTITGINYFQEKSPYGIKEGTIIIK